MAAPIKPRRISQLGAMKVLKPEEWERQIREAMLATDGRIAEAAEVLGVSTRQLYRWLSEATFDDVSRAPQGRPTSSE
jgi:DNA-binding NtrC family response regulator